MMPEMDGFEFVAELRRDEAWRSIPVVVDHRQGPVGATIVSGSTATSQKILQKGTHGRDELLADVRELVAASVARRRSRG